MNNDNQFSELKNTLSKSDSLEECHFQEAAYELTIRQFLYRDKRNQKKHYQLIVDHQKYFLRLTNALNYKLEVNERNGYVGVIPINFSRAMTLDETLSLLVIRNIYEEEVNSFNTNDDASVDIDLVDFQLRYEAMTHRELPQSKAELQRYIAPMVRCGVLSESNEEQTNRSTLHIHSAITSLLNTEATHLLEAHIKAKNIDTLKAVS